MFMDEQLGTLRVKIAIVTFSIAACSKTTRRRRMALYAELGMRAIGENELTEHKKS